MISSEPIQNEKKISADIATVSNNSPATTAEQDPSSHQLFLSSQFISHNAKSGLNPLVDAAGYLFSIIGKLKQLKSYRHLNQLQKELIHEINSFQDNAKAHGYSSEYILVSRYALCATLDDIISNTLWGIQGQWENYSLLAAFSQEPTQQNQDRFFTVLERIVQDPTLYIDLMEFMYVCLSLGFKGSYRATEFSHNQLEQMINSLYKRIRSQRGDFSKMLSPFPIKMHAPTKPHVKPISLWLIVSLTIAVIFALFIGLEFMLDTISNQAYQELIHIGKSILYENQH